MFTASRKVSESTTFRRLNMIQFSFKYCRNFIQRSFFTFLSLTLYCLVCLMFLLCVMFKTKTLLLLLQKYTTRKVFKCSTHHRLPFAFVLLCACNTHTHFRKIQHRQHVKRKDFAVSRFKIFQNQREKQTTSFRN